MIVFIICLAFRMVKAVAAIFLNPFMGQSIIPPTMLHIFTFSCVFMHRDLNCSVGDVKELITQRSWPNPS